jgi:hypothetical protein
MDAVDDDVVAAAVAKIPSTVERRLPSMNGSSMWSW